MNSSKLIFLLLIVTWSFWIFKIIKIAELYFSIVCSNVIMYWSFYYPKMKENSTPGATRDYDPSFLSLKTFKDSHPFTNHSIFFRIITCLPLNPFLPSLIFCFFFPYNLLSSRYHAQGEELNGSRVILLFLSLTNVNLAF